MHLNFTMRSWLLIIVPMTICLSHIVSIGPDAQNSVVGLVSGDAPTIYGSAYAESIARFPDLREWLLMAGHWQFIIIALLIVVAGCIAKTLAEQILISGMSAWVTLTIFDVINVAIDGSFNLSEILLNIGINLFGYLIIALIISAILWLYEKIAALSGQIVGGLYLILAGLMISISAYYALLYFYKPLPIHVMFDAKAPIRGVYVGEPAARASHGASSDEPLKFSAVPENVRGGSAEINSPAGRLALSWRSNQPSAIFAVTFDFYTSCIGLKAIGSLPVATNGLRYSNVRSLSMSFDEGYTWLSMAENSNNSLSYNEKMPTMFWASVKKERAELSFFTTGQGVVRNVGSDDQAFYLAAPLLRSNGKSGRVVPRTLTVIVNGEPFRVSFRRPAKFDPKAKLRCAAFELSGTPLRHPSSQILPKGASMIGVRVRIDPINQLDIEEYPIITNTLELTGGNGWIKLTDIDATRLQNQVLGTTDFIVIDQGLEQLSVDDDKRESRRSDSFVAFGEIHGTYNENRGMSFSGKAIMAWLNGKRLNPTKWERLPTDIQIFVLTTLLAALVGLVRISKPVILRLKRPDKLAGLQAG